MDLKNFPYEASIVIATYDRKDITLRCLDNLAREGVLDWAEIILVDDGSSDKTVEEVEKIWPQIKIVSGDGNLWWGGAMRLGMRIADPGTPCLIWLNNDCRPRPGVLQALRAYALKNRCVASALSVAPSGFFYGGWIRTAWGLCQVAPDSSSIVKIDSFGGNCVAFPRHIVEAVGEMDPRLFHNWADADYALRIRAAGFKSVILNFLICDNEANETATLGSWTESPLPFRTLFAGMRSPKSLLYWPTRAHFFRKHWGWGWGSVLALWPYARFFVMWAISAVFGRGALRTLRRSVKRPSVRN
ncbi:MAG TPA: glycosyltransferase family 2 protein [Chthoniobacterales bacterium]